MKKTISIVLVICMAAALLAACGSQQAGSSAEESSAFTANIDKYWQEHDIDGMLAERNNSEEALAGTRAQMLAMYGENKEITGDYDEELAAKTVSGTYVGQTVSDEVVSWKGIPYAKQPVGELRWRAPQAPDASDKVYEAYCVFRCKTAMFPLKYCSPSAQLLQSFRKGLQLI